MMRKPTYILLILFLGGSVLYSCDDPESPAPEFYEDVQAELQWGGSPATDGSGLLLVTKVDTYGVPGDKSDFEHIFVQDENSTDVLVDFLLTGEKTSRGWGVTYDEIDIITIERYSDVKP